MQIFRTNSRVNFSYNPHVNADVLPSIQVKIKICLIFLKYLYLVKLLSQFTPQNCCFSSYFGSRCKSLICLPPCMEFQDFSHVHVQIISDLLEKMPASVFFCSSINISIFIISEFEHLQFLTSHRCECVCVCASAQMSVFCTRKISIITPNFYIYIILFNIYHFKGNVKAGETLFKIANITQINVFFNKHIDNFILKALSRDLRYRRDKVNTVLHKTYCLVVNCCSK